MDGGDYLRCRNIQLETELRLVKEQLAQAQSGTQYLINCLSNQKSGHHQPIPAPDELRLHKVEADNLRLRRRLAFTQGVHGTVTGKLRLGASSSARRSELTHFQSSSPSPSTGTDTAQRNDSAQDDLLTYDGHDYSPPNTTIQSSPTDSFPRDASIYSSMFQSSFDLPRTLVNPIYADQDVSPTERAVQSFGLGIRGAQPSGQSSVHWTHHTTEQLNNASSYDTLNDRKDVPRQTANCASPQSQPCDREPRHIGEWRAICSPPPVDSGFAFHSPFLNVEHNRLLGAAFFIEEMSEDEKAEHWERLAFDKGRHSAKEWQAYYEEMVRPAYLAKVGRVEAAADAVSARDTTFPANNTHEVSASGFSGSAAAKENHEALLDAPQLGPGAEGSLITVKSPNKEACSPALLQGQVTPAAPLGANKVTTEPSSVKEDQCGAKVANMVDNDGGSCYANRHSHTGGQLPTGTSIVHNENHATDTPGPGDSKPTTDNPPTSPQVLSGYPSITPLSSKAPAFDPTLTPSLPAISRADTPVRRSPHFSQFPTEASEILHDIDNEDESRFHTVIISDIPTTVSLSDIVAKVRGGKMLSAKFIATAGMKTIPPLDTNATLIVFLSAQRAKAYADFCQQEGIFFESGGDDLEHVRATVQMIRTPTMSMHPRILFDLRERALTRVLFVIDAQHKWTAEQVVEQLVRHDWNLERPLVAGRDEDGILFFEFADVRDAAAAWRAVDRDRWYFDGASKGFLPDPCDRPLETLREVDDVANMLENWDIGGNSSSDGSDGEDTVVDTPATTANNSFATDGLESERTDDSAGDP
ncbi:hypothetical protein LTR37_005172 [Vermiconidia calcicola]|uniref:Uncharacterized protein n=1 Tax=Vermiconidia calcicola TaxID=1690605 RepID=A0ACC3NMW3_9PEZI|nr:hypothetical protein LTR37_005172 [Vermiconidia calcicola]